MKVAISYPVNFSLWWQHKEWIQRFARTFREFPPAYDYELYLIHSWGQPCDQLIRWFYGIRTKYTYFDSDSCDIGAAQHLSFMVPDPETLIVGFPTHAYFHREGWLARLVAAREKFGEGLYSPAGSYEVRPHLRTCGYLIDGSLLRRSPAVRDRSDCEHFERGQRSITQWVSDKDHPCFQVTWDGVQGIGQWREPPGIFRRGEQNAMLVWDRHTDIYKDATPEEKIRLERLADGV